MAKQCRNEGRVGLGFGPAHVGGSPWSLAAGFLQLADEQPQTRAIAPVRRNSSRQAHARSMATLKSRVSGYLSAGFFASALRIATSKPSGIETTRSRNDCTGA